MTELRNRSTVQLSQLPEADIIALIERCNTEIARLESQLAEQRDIKTALENLYAPFHRAGSTLNRIPDEILMYIFSEVIRDDPQAIGPILFVCRLWNKIACNAPMLWTDIVSKPDATPASIDRGTEYLRSAIRYSRSLPLNVTLHLISQEDVWNDIVMKMWPYLPKEHPEYRFYEDAAAKRGDMVQYFKEMSGLGDDLSFYNTRDREVTELLHWHIDTFVRIENGANEGGSETGNIDNEDEDEDWDGNLNRIHNLTIYYDSSKYRNWIHAEKDHLFELFRPKPERVAIVDTNRQVLNIDSPLYNTLNPNLRYLSWRAGCSCSHVVSDPGVLVHLRLHWKNESFLSNPGRTNLPRTELTQNLRYLFLYVSKDINVGQTLHLNQQPHLFPNLEDLTLAGIFDAKIFEALDTPRLTVLRLIEPIGDDVLHKRLSRSMIPLNKISRLHVHNTVCGDDRFGLEKILANFPSITELGIVGHIVDDVKACLSEVKGVARREGLRIKGFKYSPMDYWKFDSYDYDEIWTSP